MRWRSIPQSNRRACFGASLAYFAQIDSSVTSSAPSSTVSPSVTWMATTRPAWGLGISSATLPVSKVSRCSSWWMMSPILTSNSSMKTAPLAHAPQLCQHSGYLGMRTKMKLICGGAVHLARCLGAGKFGPAFREANNGAGFRLVLGKKRGAAIWNGCCGKC